MSEKPEAAISLSAAKQSADCADAWQQRHARRQRKAGRRVRMLPAGVLEGTSPRPETSALDAAAFLCRFPRPLSWLKLQDLLYFALAWHLVWDSELLFHEPVIATADGIRIDPVNDLLAGKFEVTERQLRKAQPERLTESQQRSLAGILDFYGHRSHFRLAELIRQDAAWRQARTLGDAPVDTALLYRHYRDL